MKNLRNIIEGFFKTSGAGYGAVAKELLINEIKDVLLDEFKPKGKLRLKFSEDPNIENMLVVYNDYESSGIEDISQLRRVREWVDGWQGNSKYFNGQVGAMEMPVYNVVLMQDNPSKTKRKARFGI